jgi:hypothetical protein
MLTHTPHTPVTLWWPCSIGLKYGNSVKESSIGTLQLLMLDLDPFICGFAFAQLSL